MYTESPFGTPQDRLRRMFPPGSILTRLIMINVAVFLAVNVINLFVWLFQLDTNGQAMLQWLAVPADPEVLLRRPWTLLTYMFYQESVMHILFNMIMLYFGGRIFLEFLGKERLTGTYIMGGLFGASFFILAYNSFPVFASELSIAVALGASASVLAILVAVASYAPEYSITLFLFGRVKLKYIAIAFIILDIFSIQRGNAGGHIAHLGGAVWGFAAARLLKQGVDVWSWLRFPKVQSRDRSSQYSRRWKRYTTTTPPGDRPLNDEEYNKRRVMKQQRMDEILDKISRMGYDSLTKEEKEFLFRKGNDK